MRTGEVFALTWEDVDFENKVINVRNSVFDKKKNDKGRWYIGTTKILSMKPANMIFIRDNGKYCGTDIIKYPYKIIHNELGIEKCRFYDLRGSYATTILRNGVEIRDVADVLGHKDIETTENYYISSTDETRKNVIDCYEDTINSNVIDEIIEYKISI